MMPSEAKRGAKYICFLKVDLFGALPHSAVVCGRVDIREDPYENVTPSGG